MPKAMNFKANSVIYFQGDVSDRIFVLKSGRISLTSNDIETGQEIHDYIQTGEFFGVKSAFGKYPREEDAVVLADSSVVVFSVPEFEQLVAANTRVIMKMLKVFSNQLRRIHAKVRNLLALEEQVEPEVGLFRIGEYYLRKKQYNEAAYVFKRHLELYPSGSMASEAKDHLRTALSYAEKYGQGKGPAVPGVGAPAAVAGKPGRKPEAAFEEAMSLAGKGRHQEAIARFKELAEGSGDDGYRSKALVQIGRCLHDLGKYEAAIKHLGALVQKNPRLESLPHALYYLGESYRQLGENERAKVLYTKVLSLQNVGRDLTPKVKRALAEVEAG